MNGGRTIPYEPGLDGLRGISILAVMAFHACATSGLSGWFRGGNLGVSVFFTLSGFLITGILTTEIARDGRIDLGRFWTRRIRRLVPASLTVVLCVVVLTRAGLFEAHASDATAAIWSATNWHVIAAGQDQLLRTIVGPLGPTWSLAVEEQFYVVLAIGVALASRAERPDRLLVIGFGVMIAGSVVLANLVSDWPPRLEFGTDVRAGELATGGLLAIVARRTTWPERTALAAALLRKSAPSQPGPASQASEPDSSVAGTLRPGRLVDAIGVVGLAALASLVLFADYSPPWLLRGGFVVVALVTAAIVVSIVGHGRVGAVLSIRWLVATGRWSYSLYLVHWPVFLALSADRMGFYGVPLVAAKFAVAGAIGVALHLVVEQPVRAAAPTSPAFTASAWLATSAAVTAIALALL